MSEPEEVTEDRVRSGARREVGPRGCEEREEGFEEESERDCEDDDEPSFHGDLDLR